MAYTLKSYSTNRVYLVDSGTSINVDVTILFNKEGETKLADTSIGTTINILLDDSPRNTIVSELETKMNDWFNTEYNPPA